MGCPPPGESPVEVGFDYRPAWSPDGTQIAFISYVGSGSDVFIMNAQAPTNAENPAWSRTARGSPPTAAPTSHDAANATAPRRRTGLPDLLPAHDPDNTDGVGIASCRLPGTGREPHAPGPQASRP